MTPMDYTLRDTTDYTLCNTMDHTLCDTTDYTLHDTTDHIPDDTMNRSQYFEHHAITPRLEHPQPRAENIFEPPPFMPHNHASYSSARTAISFAVWNDPRFGRTSGDYRSTSHSLPYLSESCENRQVLSSEYAVRSAVWQDSRRYPASLPTTTSTFTDEHPASVYRQHPEYKVYWFLTCWKAVVINGPRKFVEQTIYQPKSEGDQARYVSSARLQPPIIFFAQDSPEWGVPLQRLLSRGRTGLARWNEPAFTSCGPSIGIRLEWPGYPPYHKQVKTSDYSYERRMIRKAKLAQIVAKCVKEFIEKMGNKAMQAGVDHQWRVGPQGITVNDIILVSLHHVSKGSWQPQLRLCRIVRPGVQGR